MLPKREIGVMATILSDHRLEPILERASRLESFCSGRLIFSKTLLTDV
jgi:hypothetical protein